MKKLPKVATLLAIGSVSAAGLAVTPASASETCGPGYTRTAVDGTTSELDRNDNGFVCVADDGSGDVRDDHPARHAPKKGGGGKK